MCIEAVTVGMAFKVILQHFHTHGLVWDCSAFSITSIGDYRESYHYGTQQYYKGGCKGAFACNVSIGHHHCLTAPRTAVSLYWSSAFITLCAALLLLQQRATQTHFHKSLRRELGLGMRWDTHIFYHFYIMFS